MDSPAMPTVELQTITAEILILKRQTAANIIEIGRRLQQAKEGVGHGNWLPYLRDQVQFTERTAQRFMRAAAELGNTTSLSLLEPTKALLVLEAPDEDREALAERAADMSTRQLEEAVRDVNQARREAAEAQARAGQAEARVKELESRPAPTRSIIMPDPRQQLEMDRLRAQLADAECDLNQLRTQADKSGGLEAEIKAKEQRLRELAELEQQMGARFDDADRDPDGGLKLMEVLHPITRLAPGIAVDVRGLKTRGVGGWCKDEEIQRLADKLRELTGLLDEILADRAARPIVADFREV